MNIDNLLILHNEISLSKVMEKQWVVFVQSETFRTLFLD